MLTRGSSLNVFVLVVKVEPIRSNVRQLAQRSNSTLTSICCRTNTVASVTPTFGNLVNSFLSSSPDLDKKILVQILSKEPFEQTYFSSQVWLKDLLEKEVIQLGSFTSCYQDRMCSSKVCTATPSFPLCVGSWISILCCLSFLAASSANWTFLLILPNNFRPGCCMRYHTLHLETNKDNDGCLVVDVRFWMSWRMKPT